MPVVIRADMASRSISPKIVRTEMSDWAAACGREKQGAALYMKCPIFNAIHGSGICF